jgi:hypothetical protein
LKTEPFTREEAVEILQEIPRPSKNAAARIAAVKQLHALEREGPLGPYDELDELLDRTGR